MVCDRCGADNPTFRVIVIPKYDNHEESVPEEHICRECHNRALVGLTDATAYFRMFPIHRRVDEHEEL